MTEQHRIILTEGDTGYWTAREEPSGFTTYGTTLEAALSALDHDNEPEVYPDASSVAVGGRSTRSV